jgi:hypothetical protein
MHRTAGVMIAASGNPLADVASRLASPEQTGVPILGISVMKNLVALL